MKKILRFFFPKLSPHFVQLYILHILNDGSKSGFLLLLPFITKDLSLSLTQAGFLAMIVNSFSFVFALPAAYIAKKFGGLRILVISLFIYALGFLLTGSALHYFWLFPIAILVGLGLCVFHPIGLALIATWTEKIDRGKQMGNFTAIGDLGRIGIAAFLTFIVALIGWRLTTFLYALPLIGLAILFYVFFLPKHENVIALKKKKIDIRFLDIIRHKQFFLTTIVYFFDNLASGSFFIFLPFLLLFRGVSPALLGSFVGLFFLGNFFGKTILGRFVDIFGSSKVFILSEVLMAIFIFLLASTTSLPMIIFCSLILGVFTKGTSPIIQTMVTESTEHHGNFEKAFGLNQFSGSIATAISPLLLGFTSDKFGIVSAFYLMVAFALLAIIPAIGFHFSYRDEKVSNRSQA